MPKIDFFGLPRAERPESTKTYREAGRELTLSMRWPNASDRAAASEDAQELAKMFITGDPELVREAAPFPCPDVIPSVMLFNACALVARMQMQTEERERYSAIDFAVASAKLPRMWMAIQNEVNRLLMEGDQSQGELPGASTASSAETPSEATTNIR